MLITAGTAEFRPALELKPGILRLLDLEFLQKGSSAIFGGNEINWEENRSTIRALMARGHVGGPHMRGPATPKTALRSGLPKPHSAALLRTRIFVRNPRGHRFDSCHRKVPHWKVIPTNASPSVANPSLTNVQVWPPPDIAFRPRSSRSASVKSSLRVANAHMNPNGSRRCP